MRSYYGRPLPKPGTVIQVRNAAWTAAGKAIFLYAPVVEGGGLLQVAWVAEDGSVVLSASKVLQADAFPVPRQRRWGVLTDVREDGYWHIAAIHPSGETMCLWAGCRTFNTTAAARRHWKHRWAPWSGSHPFRRLSLNAFSLRFVNRVARLQGKIRRDAKAKRAVKAKARGKGK